MGRGPAKASPRTTARTATKAPRTAKAGAASGSASTSTKTSAKTSQKRATGAKATPAKAASKPSASPKATAKAATKSAKPAKAKPAKAKPAKAKPASVPKVSKAAKAVASAKGRPVKPSTRTRPKTDKAPRAPRAKGTPPGRMRAPIAPIDTIRTPAKADDLKARLGRISSVIVQLRGFKRTLERSFFEVGELLHDVNETRLFEVKGYSTLDAFLDRETDLGSSAGLRALRAFGVFQREAAESAGFARVSAALRALDGEPETPSVGDRHTAASLPPHKLW